MKKITGDARRVVPHHGVAFVSRVDQCDGERDRVHDAANIEGEDAVRPLFDSYRQLWRITRRSRD